MTNEVELTAKERRIIAEIEQYEYGRQARKRVSLAARVDMRSAARSWLTLGIGAMILMGGLVAVQPVIALAGFVVMLEAVARLSARISPTKWWRTRLELVQRRRSHSDRPLGSL